TGAALHDILTVLKRRFPAISVILYPVQVQGADAPGQIIAAIETANRLNQVDVLIVGRGGGSLEDLWSFNDERVARAVFASQLPIVSAVGHEVDVSISDFVADVRAATPSQAAELVSPDQADLYSLINHRRDQLTRRWLSISQTAQQRLSHLRQRLRDPGTLLREWQQRLDDRERRLVHALKNQQRLRLQRFESLEKRLHRASPLARLKTDQQRLGQWRQRLQRLGLEQLKPRRQQLASLAGQLNTLSPLNTLERGYSITRAENGQVIQQASQTKAGDQITTLLRDGTLTSRVE
ncbi:MAG: exodeoxyribonuclease VII large subunit, partial [Saccharospirillum sp.]